MPTTIKLKNSVTTTNTPTSLVQGEVAINITDKKVWVGNAATTPIQLLGTGADGTFTNISVSSVATFGAGTVSAPAITTTGDTNTGIFFPAADTIAFTEGGVESMRIDSSGNVGIGVTPSNWGSAYKALQVGLNASVAGNTSGSVVLLSTNTVFDGSSYKYITTDAATQYQQNTGEHIWRTAASGSAGATLTFSERMRIDSSGNVGIGTSSPAKKLDVSGTGRFTGELALGNDLNQTTDGYIYSSNGGGGVRSGFFLDGTNQVVKAFTAATERMRITSAGNLLVGTTSAISSGFTTISYSGAALNGLIISESANTSDTSFLGFNNGATNIGSVSRVGATSAVVYSTTSDQRLKSNIADANPVLDKLMDVKVRQFDWTEGNLHQDAGFIAQELAPVLSGIVTQGKTEEDMWQLDYSRLTPYLVKAIQEQQALIENLTTRLNALEGN